MLKIKNASIICVMKLSHSVIVDDGSNYVMFQQLDICIKIRKNNNSSQRELGMPVVHLANQGSSHTINILFDNADLNMVSLGLV